MGRNMLALEYFPGGIPAGMMYIMDSTWLDKLVLSIDESITYNRVSEISLIALLAYFESFCKNHFASLINISPALLHDYCKKRPDLAISIPDLLLISDDPKNRLGFLISDRIDFGSPQKINTHYQDLIGVSPFSSKESRQYEDILADRNLIVHHGGILTAKYHRTRNKTESKGELYYDSIVINKQDFVKYRTFLDGIARKIAQSTSERLYEFAIANDSVTSPETMNALALIGKIE